MEKTIKTMIKDHEDNDGHFFSGNNIRFWNSTIESELLKGAYFITSEDNYNRSRLLYSIHKYDWEEHDVKTLIFQGYKTRNEALYILNNYLFLKEAEEKKC